MAGTRQDKERERRIRQDKERKRLSSARARDEKMTIHFDNAYQGGAISHFFPPVLSTVEGKINK